MTNPLVTTYAQLERLMRSAGHVFDCGQISPSVVAEAYALAEMGILNISHDSWPVRGFSGKECRMVYELVNRKPLDTPPHLALSHI